MADKDGKEIGEFLRAVRVSKGLSQRQFAESINSSGAYVNLIEQGRHRYPYKIVARLTKADKLVALEILAKYQREDVGL